MSHKVKKVPELSSPCDVSVGDARALQHTKQTARICLNLYVQLRVQPADKEEEQADGEIVFRLPNEGTKCSAWVGYLLLGVPLFLSWWWCRFRHVGASRTSNQPLNNLSTCWLWRILFRGKKTRSQTSALRSSLNFTD